MADSGSMLPAQARSEATPIRLGGLPSALLSARGSLWVLTCEHRCSGEGRRSVGRIVRIDPRQGRVLASAPIERPGAIAVGARGVYLTDFWRQALRRLDPARLQERASLKLVLPFQVASRYAAFLPTDVALGAGSTWVSTQWCALARVDLRLSRTLAAIRLPCDAYQTMAFGAGALWISESLAGVYRVDPRTNRVSARIQIGPRTGRLVATRFLFARGVVLALGAWTQAGSLTGRNGLARLDPSRNRIVGITVLPPGQLLAAFDQGALWVAQVGGSTVVRIDPRSGRATGHLRAKLGSALAAAAGRLWTADPNGTIRPL